MTNIFDQDLDPNSANFTALSPVSFVERSAEIFGDLSSVVHGHRKYTWAQTRDRSARLAAALQSLGVARGTTVSAMLPNTPEMLEVHYAVPALNAVLNPLNTRLDAALIAWQLNHCECAVLITDREFAPVMAKALDILKTQFGRSIVVVDVCDSEYTGPGEQLGQYEYEAWLASHEPLSKLEGPQNEWDAIAVSYTSGTTGDPKGVVTHHRGAYLNAVSNVATWTMPHFPTYLWTLPMFHCNGWCFPWTVAMQAGVHVCLRRVEPAAILAAMREHAVDHYCAAPIVHSLIYNAPAELRQGINQQVRGMVAGAAPPAAMIEGMEQLGFDLTHVYGLTEVYGPAAVCAVTRDAVEEHRRGDDLLIISLRETLEEFEAFGRGDEEVQRVDLRPHLVGDLIAHRTGVLAGHADAGKDRIRVTEVEGEEAGDIALLTTRLVVDLLLAGADTTPAPPPTPGPRGARMAHGCSTA